MSDKKPLIEEMPIVRPIIDYKRMNAVTELALKYPELIVNTEHTAQQLEFAKMVMEAQSQKLEIRIRYEIELEQERVRNLSPRVLEPYPKNRTWLFTSRHYFNHSMLVAGLSTAVGTSALETTLWSGELQYAWTRPSETAKASLFAEIIVIVYPGGSVVHVSGQYPQHQEMVEYWFKLSPPY